MRNIPLILALILLFLVSYGQKANKFYLDEICISGNKTHVKNENTEDRNGYGVCAISCITVICNWR